MIGYAQRYVGPFFHMHRCLIIMTTKSRVRRTALTMQCKDDRLGHSM